MAWAPGQSLQGGKYTIERVLGEGGFGVTYLARQTGRRQDEQWVVIKMLRESRLSPKFQQDFLNEALKLAKCSHPHIVEVKELIREDDLDGIVMEYIAGESLADRLTNSLRQGIPLLEPEALRYIQQVGDALTVVHKRNLLHRDIKPQNVMIRSGTSEAVLIDFGLAREFMQDVTLTHSLALTHGYAPIEQYNPSAKRGAYTDVYALAATLYCLLAGQTPPPAIARMSGTGLESPKRLNPRISDRTNQAILKGLALQPGDRPQSMQEWLQSLEESKSMSSPSSGYPQTSLSMQKQVQDQASAPSPPTDDISFFERKSEDTRNKPTQFEESTWLKEELVQPNRARKQYGQEIIPESLATEMQEAYERIIYQKSKQGVSKRLLKWSIGVLLLHAVLSLCLQFRFVGLSVEPSPAPIWMMIGTVVMAFLSIYNFSNEGTWAIAGMISFFWYLVLGMILASPFAAVTGWASFIAMWQARLGLSWQDHFSQRLILLVLVGTSMVGLALGWLLGIVV